MFVLNEEQKKYVECLDDSLVIACPGSGKTRSICLKVSYLLEQNANPRDHVAVLTFTNRAADEIFDRISLTTQIPKNLWLGTIHSFCLEWILRSFQNEIEHLSRGFTLADEFTQYKILGELKTKYKVNPYDNINTKLDTNGAYLEKDQTKINILKEYHKELKRLALIDYDQVLYFCYLFLKNNQRAATMLGNLFKWIIVDEYQDTQELQYQIIGLLKKFNRFLKVSFVGDPDQAIFAGLGGIAYNKASLEKICGVSFKEHQLVGCYRSSQKIIDYYSKYKAQNGSIKSLANITHSTFIKYNNTISKDSLSLAILSIIRHELSSGVVDKDICVLSPQWDNLKEIALELKRQAPDISIDAPGVSPISKNRENIWFPLSKILLTESSPENFRRRMKWAREAIQFISDLRGSPLEMSALSFLEVVNLSKSSNTKGIEFLSDSIQKTLSFVGVDLALNELANERFNTFLEGTKKRLTDYSIPDDVDTFRSFYKESEGIVLSSFHGVKGEEYEVVIAVGLLKGKVPHWDVVINESIGVQNSEANKLLYVISSRAKSRLYLFSETGYKTKGGKAYEPTTQLTQNYFYDP
ncbi:MAG: ATP-dependent helicase [Bacteriovorax sp.]